MEILILAILKKKMATIVISIFGSPHKKEENAKKSKIYSEEK